MAKKDYYHVELTMNKVLIVVVLLGILMSVFIHYYLKQREYLESNAIKSMAASFSAQVVAARAQWFIEQQPSTLIMKGYDEDENNFTKRVTLNKAGWIDVNDKLIQQSQGICQQVWLMVMNRPLVFFKGSITSVLVNKSKNEFGHVCRYIVNSGEYFEYNSENGKVSDIFKLHE